jgi:DNA-binding NarL/FixJ family response regulator
VAEGVETESELRALLSVGVDLVQGYLTGRPQPPPLRLEPIVRKLFSQHILLVDDDAVVRAVLRDRLSKGGSTIVGEAADGLEALEAAEQMRPDIIVLDLHMPRLDGLSAIPLLREIAPRAAILAVTSAHDQETAVMQLGAAAYVSKADALDVLPELVDRLRR